MSDTTYLTAEGAEKLQKELDNLKGPVRDDLAKRLRAAIEQGDLSENADYIAAKEEQGFHEGRIQELEAILSNYKIIDHLEREHGVVNIGDTVVIQEDGEETEEYTIVGSQEANPLKNRISFRSPIGSAIYMHREGEKVVAKTPSGEINFTIIKIK